MGATSFRGLKTDMAYRVQANRDAFDGVIAGAPANETLEVLARAIDWRRIREVMAPAYDHSGRGKAGFDPVVLFKMLLLEHLFQLSDVQVSVEAGDRLSFRRFLGLSAGDTPPDDTTLVRFRKRLRQKGLLGAAERDIAAQLREKGLSVRPGAIKVVDATLIRAATRPPSKPGETGLGDAAENGGENGPDTTVEDPQQPSERRLDRDAAYGGKPGNFVYGYKLHAAVDVERGVVTAFDVTPANVHDSQRFGALLDGNERAVLADKGYDSDANRRALARAGTYDGIMRREVAGSGRLFEIERARNRGLSRFRAPGEGIFAWLKRFRKLSRAVYLGIERMREQTLLAVMASNLLKLLPGLRERCAQK